jgi:TonB family protein
MLIKTIKNLNFGYFWSDTTGVMKPCIFFSLLLHIILLFYLQNSFTSDWNFEKLRTYQIEIIRPPVDDLDFKNMSSANIEHLKQEKPVDTVNEQDTISLDTKDKRYVTYATIIKQQIMRQWKYPPEAKLYLLEGKLIVLFSLSKNGQMKNIKITSSSGYAILDNEVIRSITTAAPFTTFPESIKVQTLNINAAFDYRLTSRKNEKSGP